MGEVVEADIITRLDIPVERVLRKAIEAELSSVVILGYAQDGKWKELYITLYKCGRDHAECKAFKELQKDRETLLLETEAGLCEELGIKNYTPGEFLALLGGLREVVEWLKENPELEPTF